MSKAPRPDHCQRDLEMARWRAYYLLDLARDAARAAGRELFAVLCATDVDDDDMRTRLTTHAADLQTMIGRLSDACCAQAEAAVLHQRDDWPRPIPLWLTQAEARLLVEALDDDVRPAALNPLAPVGAQLADRVNAWHQ